MDAAIQLLLAKPFLLCSLRTLQSQNTSFLRPLLISTLSFSAVMASFEVAAFRTFHKTGGLLY
jgi:hypothetical protein